MWDEYSKKVLSPSSYVLLYEKGCPPKSSNVTKFGLFYFAKRNETKRNEIYGRGRKNAY